MTTSRQHQEAHGIGQIEEQLEQQSSSASELQGPSELDREVNSVANRRETELDKIIEE
jgi:hypothetical protein